MNTGVKKGPDPQQVVHVSQTYYFSVIAPHRFQVFSESFLTAIRKDVMGRAEAQPNYFSPGSGLKVAMHIRRGDVGVKDKKVALVNLRSAQTHFKYGSF